MRLYVWISFILLSKVESLAQSPDQFLYKEPAQVSSKPSIDFKAIDNWRMPQIRNEVLSYDGRYCSYRQENGSLIVQSTDAWWKEEIMRTEPGFFAGSNREYIYRSQDSLCFLQLGKGRLEIKRGITGDCLPGNGRNELLGINFEDKSFIVKDLLTGKERHYENVETGSFATADGQWIAFRLANSGNELVLYHLPSNRRFQYQGVEEYEFGKTDRNLILKTVRGEERYLIWVNPFNGNEKQVWNGHGKNTTIGGHAFDESAGICSQ